MRARPLVCAALTLLTLLPALGRAQEPAVLLEPLERSELPAVGGGAPLALGDVLESVRAHHPALDVLDARREAAEGARLAAEGGFDPTLSARGSLALLGYYEYGRADVFLTQASPLWGTSFFAGWRVGRALGGGGVPDYYGYDETLDAGEVRAGVTVPLLRDGWTDARRTGIVRAERGVEIAEAELDARRLRVELAASEAYFRWVAAGRKLAIGSRLLELAEARDAQLLTRARAGAIAPIEHLENRRAVLERRQALVVGVRALERAAIALSLYLRDGGGAPRVPGPTAVPDALAPPSAPPEDEARAIEDALSRRPELERLRAARAAADASRALADNQILPRLDLTASGSLDLGTAADAALRSQLTPPVVEGMLVFSIPLLLREARGRADGARAEVRALDAELELAADTIAIEVRDALSAVRAAEAAVALARESAALSERVAAAERTRFEAGASSLLIVNLREAAAAQAAAAEVDALADVAIAHALLRAVTAEGAR